MPSSIRKALNELPTTLDVTYERALQGILKEKRQHAYHLFQCLVVAIRPLRVEEIAELFAIEFDHDSAPNLKEGWRPENPEEAVLSACSTLIAVIENKGSKIVQFSHFSVKEYLISDRLRTSEIGNIRHNHISFVAAQTVLARACLTVLLQLDETVDKKRLETFPLASYAAQHWVEHAKYEEVASRIQHPMQQLFNPSKPYLAAWTMIHDMDAYIQLPVYPLEREWLTPRRPTALYYAALCGFSGLANYLIVRHAEDVNANCGYHGTPLHAASYKGHLDVARVLLSHAADVNSTNKGKMTPLCSAYSGKHLGAMRLLLEHGADVDVYVEHGYTRYLLLHDASLFGRADVVYLLLQHNVDVNTTNEVGSVALHATAMSGQAEIAQLLLEHGAVVNAQDCRHNTPLYYASQYGRLAVVQVLLGCGADVHTWGEQNWTAFQVAKLEGRVDIAQLLLEHGAEKE